MKAGLLKRAVRPLRRLLLLSLIALSLLPPGVALAGAREDLPSCWGRLKDAPERPLPMAELFLLVDQTFAPDPRLQRAVLDKTLRFLKPGMRLSLLSFSSYAGGDYADLKLAATLEPELTDAQRFELGKKSLQQFDGCMRLQQQALRKVLEQKLMASFGQPGNARPNSELAGTLHHVQQQLIAHSVAPRRVLLLVSDMLEHSDVSTFYAKNSARKVDPGLELEKFVQAGLVGQWQGADVYVLGAGFSSGDGGYRSEAVMASIQRFWQSYFARAGANLRGWGQPMLLDELHL